MVKELTARNIKVKRGFAPKCLDDIIPIGRVHTGLVEAYVKEYTRICLACGIRLAEETDGPGKVCPIGQEGEILGIYYNLKEWTWNIPLAKDLRLRNQMWQALEDGSLKKTDLETIIGKITHYSPLIRAGKWNRSWLLKMDKVKMQKEDIMQLTPGAANQLRWWLAALSTCANGARIPDIRDWTIVEGISLHSDAAGGGTGAGFGGVAVNTPSEEKMAWCQETWPDWLNCGMQSPTGDVMGQKLTFLEGFASLCMLSVMAEEAKGRTVYLHVGKGNLTINRSNMLKHVFQTMLDFVGACGRALLAASLQVSKNKKEIRELTVMLQPQCVRRCMTWQPPLEPK